MTRRFPMLIAAAAATVAVALSVGCAHDQKTAVAGPRHHLRLSGDREPFTFSSYDIGRVEWSSPAGEPVAEPPDVSAVVGKGTVLPIRGLTLEQAKAADGMTAGPPAKATDASGHSWPAATPVTGSGFRFDFVDGRLVHFVAAPVTLPDGGTLQPVFENHAKADLDVNGQVRRYTLPLDHDGAEHLFGNFEGLETDLTLPSL